jgi:hypothetical protein
MVPAAARTTSTCFVPAPPAKWRAHAVWQVRHQRMGGQPVRRVPGMWHERQAHPCRGEETSRSTPPKECGTGPYGVLWHCSPLRGTPEPRGSCTVSPVSPSTDVARGEPSPSTDVARGEPSPSTDVARGEPSPSADVARGEPSPSTDVARGEPSPSTDVAQAVQGATGRAPPRAFRPACMRAAHGRRYSPPSSAKLATAPGPSGRASEHPTLL